jgi:hypothetical protein
MRPIFEGDGDATIERVPMRRPIAAFGLAAGLYVLLTVALTWPLILHMGSRVPNDLGDSLLNMFLLAWNARELPLTEQWWNLPQFYPAPGVMAFSEHLLGLAPITTPIILLTGDTLLAYNAAFLLSFPLCAFAAHLLCYELTRRHDVSTVAAIAFGFAPYRMAQFAHVQVLSAYWLPLMLLGLHLFLRTGRWRHAVLFAAAWLMQSLACGYYLFYASVLVGLWLLWFAVGRQRLANLVRLLVAWAVAVAALLPIGLGYLKHQRAYGLRRWPDEIEAFSADVASLLTAPGTLRLWGWLKTIERPESELFPGLALVLLIAAGGAVAWAAASRAGVERRRTARILFALALLVGAVAATPLWFGPWKLEIGGIRLLSVGTPQKPFSIAVLLAAIGLALHPSIRTGWRQRSPLAFYTLGAVAMWLFSLGPSPTLMNRPLLYKAPYSWLMLLPGVEGVRVPARFWVLATMCLAIAGGLALVHVTARWPAARKALPWIAGLLMLVEAWPQPLALADEPAPRPAHSRSVARLDLPFTPGHDLVVLYRAIEHRLPVVNGYSGYFAPHYEALQFLLERRDPAAFAYLTTLGPIEVVIDDLHDPDEQWRRYLAAQPDVETVHDGGGYTAFRLGRRTATVELAHFIGQPVRIQNIVATQAQDRVGHMTDGNRITRWDTAGPQTPDNTVTVDLGAPRPLEGIEIQLGGYVADFPREFAIDLSDDGATWRAGWRGNSGAIALVAALDDPFDIPLRYPLDGSAARYVRMRQLSSDPVYYWSIAELRVLEKPGASR